MREALLLIPLLTSLTCPPLAAADWPQWRGPALDGSSPETGLPLRWQPDRNVAWRLPLPARGAATPIVSGNRLFLAGSDGTDPEDALWIWAVDRDRGVILWQRDLGRGNELRRKADLSSPSPVTDGKTVWVLTGTGVLAAFDFAGAQRWSRNLQEDYGPFGILWGYASSPLLHDGDLFVPVLHGFHTDDPSYVLRIDGETGMTLWRVERPTDAERESPDAYTTPMVWRRGDREEILIVGGDVVTGHDPETGKELWRRGGLNPENSGAQRLVASPVVTGDTFFVFGKRGPVLAFRSVAGGPPELVWSYRKSTDVPTPVTDGELLFTVTDDGLAFCHEVATGNAVWGPQRIAQGTYSASPILADDRVYATNESGVTTVLAAGREFLVLAENRVEGYTLASPAVSDGQIFLRTSEYLYAVGERRTSAP